MNIHITADGHDFHLALPTKLILSKPVLRFALKNGKALEQPGTISPEALERLTAELRHIKEKHGSWELAEVQSSDGARVTVIL